MKEIIFVDFAGPHFPGGCEKYFVNLSNHLAENNKVTFLHSSFFLRLIEYVYAVISNHVVGSIQLNKRDVTALKIDDVGLKNVLSVRNQLRTADIIYTKNEAQELIFLYVMLGGHLFKSKVIIGVHTPIFLEASPRSLWNSIHNAIYFSFIYKQIFKSAKKVHVPNSDYVGMLAQTYGINPQSIHVIPNPVEWKTQTVPSKTGKLSLLWLGRLSPQKGIDRLERICSLIQESNLKDKIEITLAGDGEMKNEVIALSKRFSFLSYAGFVKDVESLYRATDVSISTFYFDIFAHAVLEPQSFGIPVICYDVAGPRDIIIQDVTGRLVQNEEEFVRVIREYENMKSASIRKFNTMKKSIAETTNKRFEKKALFKRLTKMVTYE